MIRSPARFGSRLPAAILMSGTGSNARKLLEYRLPDGLPPAYEIRLILSDNPASNYRRIADEFGVEARLNDIYAFCGVPRASPPADGTPGATTRERSGAQVQGASSSPAGGDAAKRARLRDPSLRRAFDAENLRILREHGVRLAAAAGYDWVLSAELCEALPIVNVHPGDLRVLDERGRRRYVGLGWIPTAKAILHGDEAVRSTTHLVTAELDGGPIARVSRPVPVDLPLGVNPKNILPEGTSLGEVVRDLRAGGGRFGDSLIVTHARMIQERLKEAGDWVELPWTLHRVAALLAEGRLVVGVGGAALDKSPVAELFLQEESPPRGESGLQ
jgi:folate-dependent phosphoribosylglycinamide formyltransferase PurN